jgi:hypothetical protein
MENKKIYSMYHTFFGLTLLEETTIEKILNDFDIDPTILAISIKKLVRNGEIRDFYGYIINEIYETAISKELSYEVGFTSLSRSNFYRIANSNLEVIKPIKEGVWSLNHPNTFTWEVVTSNTQLKEALNNLVKI